MLPDVALLGIFDFYMDALHEDHIEGWHTLVHVCRKWRIVVFWSPRRLNLRLLCTASTPVRKMLDVWPLLPIVIQQYDDDYYNWGVDNICAALEHKDRICDLWLVDFPSSRSQMEEVLAEMQRPFPALTCLHLLTDENWLVIPVSFLGGSAPRLQILHLCGILFPGLSNLLLSATQLVDLDLCIIPLSEYISPETMLSYFSELTRLERLKIDFESPQSLPDHQRSRDPLLLTRTLFPVLKKLCLEGVSEYLDGLVACIDTPLLNTLVVTVADEPIFNTPQLVHFINRTPTLKAQDEARLVFEPDVDAWITFPQAFGGKIRVEIASSPSNQLLSLAQLCSSSIPQPFISAVEHLYVVEGAPHDERLRGDIEKSPAQWLELLRPYTAVKNLYISWQFAPHIALTLQELVGERVTEVLPALQTLFLEKIPPVESIQEPVEQFVAARQLAGHPIAISPWKCTKDVCEETDDGYGCIVED